jgi:hypothetical protein
MDIKNAKTWLSRVNETSWHFRLVKNADVTLPRKSCTYYWVCLPHAFCRMCLVFLAVAVFASFGWFLGFGANFMKENNGAMFCPYKTKKDGKRMLCAPWEVVAFGVFAWMFMRVAAWALAHVEAVVYYIALTFVSLFCLGLATYVVLNLWPFLLAGLGKLGKLWDRICPELIVEKKEK